MSDGSFEGKVALVTGAGSGLGRATAAAFAKAGARVVVADINVAGGEETRAAIEAAGGDAKFIESDVSDASSVAAMVERTVDIYGRLDCAFNNAAINLEAGSSHFRAPREEWDEAGFDRMWAVNARGVFLCMKYEIRQMLKQGSGGAIVNTSSIEGIRAAPGSAGYAASKWAVVGLTGVAGLQFARRGIRVNAVCPGMMRTPLAQPLIDQHGEEFYANLHPIGRIAEPSEVAEAVLWLCSDKASFVVAHPLSVDGGFAMKFV